MRTMVDVCLRAAILTQKDLETVIEGKIDKSQGCGLEFATPEMVEDTFKHLFPILINSVEYSAMKTRLLTLKSFQSLFGLANENGIINPDYVNQLYPGNVKIKFDNSILLHKERKRLARKNCTAHFLAGSIPEYIF